MTNPKKEGGIGWQNGSLVGSLNPKSHGHRPSSNYIQRFKYQPSSTDPEPNLPSNIVVQFVSKQGTELGNAIDIPIDADATQLSSLIHSLLQEDDDTKEGVHSYSFTTTLERNGLIEPVELVTTASELIQQYDISTEQTLQLTYAPLSIWRVRPVSRNTDTMVGHSEAVLHVQYSPDGKHLASGGGDTNVRFWDIRTSLPKHTCPSHHNHVLCTAWSPDATQFASCDKSGVLITWDPLTGNSRKIIKAHKKYVSSMAWEPCHLNMGRCERLVTGSRDGLGKIWNARLGSCVVTLSGHGDAVECVKWGGEGWIYSASRDRTIKIWAADGKNTATGTLLKTLVGHGHRVNTLALSCDYICRTGPFQFDRNPKDPNTFQSTQQAYQQSSERYKTFQSGDMERLVSGSDDFTLCLWHPQTSKHPIKRLTGHQQLINHIAFSPDGRYFASASFDRKIKLWNGVNGDFMATFTGHVSSVYMISWSFDSRYLVSASKDSTIKLWLVASGKRAKETLPGHADEVYALDWCPDGTSVASGSKDRTIKIWKH